MISQKVLYFQNIFKFAHCKNIAKFSSAKRVTESNPLNHSMTHVGTLYKFPDTDFNKCIETQVKSDFSRLLKAFNDKSIIIRKYAIEVIEYIKSSDLNKPVIRYLFYGPNGSGKTVQMAHVSYYAYLQNDWLLLHFPNLFNFIHLSPELNFNSRDESMFDTPTLSGLWLKSFLFMNSEFLKKYNPKTLKSIEWNQKESLPEGSEWTEMINFAISRPKYSSDCIGILLREAREHAQLKHFKVLGIIRGINCLYQTSKRVDVTRKLITAERISVLNYLRRFIKNDWSNGAILSSVNLDAVYDLKARESFYPKYLLGPVGIQDIDPFVPVHVGSYSNQEVSNYLDFLNENGWLTIPEAKDPYGIGRKEICFLADNRPEELFNVTREW